MFWQALRDTLDRMSGLVMTTSESLRFILQAGASAPSADNSQPWRFDCFEGRIDLLIDRARTGLFFDANGAATLMSAGAAAENMRLAADSLGLAATLRKSNSFADTGLVASLYLQQGASTGDPLAEVICRRMTHRGLYERSRTVPPAAREAMENALWPLPGSRIHWGDSPTARRDLTQAAFGADLVRYTHPVIHKDFHETLRFGADAIRRPDGLAEETLGIEKPLTFPLRLLSPWPVAGFFNRLGLHYFMAWRGCWLPMQTAPEIGALICHDTMDYFDAGRALERVWLAATDAGLAFQPMGALPLLLVRLHELQGKGLKPHHQQRLRELDRLWRRACRPQIDSSQERLIMIFRTGYAKKPAPRSHRRPLEEFLSRGCQKHLKD